ncbi:MAG: hypothetical protein M5U34_16355 [Chloroflexi bacterium]|nr:hypothetical protein [Chloroflexota bacterium]
MKPLYGTDLKRFLRDYKRKHKPDTDIVALLQSVEYPANVGSIFRVADAVGLSGTGADGHHAHAAPSHH